MAADAKQERVDREMSVARGVTNTMMKECRIRASREHNHTSLAMFRHFIPSFVVVRFLWTEDSEDENCLT